MLTLASVNLKNSWSWRALWVIKYLTVFICKLKWRTINVDPIIQMKRLMGPESRRQVGKGREPGRINGVRPEGEETRWQVRLSGGRGNVQKWWENPTKERRNVGRRRDDWNKTHELSHKQGKQGKDRKMRSEKWIKNHRCPSSSSLLPPPSSFRCFGPLQPGPPRPLCAASCRRAESFHADAHVDHSRRPAGWDQRQGPDGAQRRPAQRRYDPKLHPDPTGSSARVDRYCPTSSLCKTLPRPQNMFMLYL